MKDHNFAIGLLLGAALEIGIGYYFFVGRHNSWCNEFAQQEMSSIMKVQEEKLGISYESKPMVECSWTAYTDIAGQYDPANDAIFLNAALVARGDNREEDARNITWTLHHELAHHYTNQRNKQINGELLIHNGQLEKIMVAEGIAEYFTRNILPEDLNNCLLFTDWGEANRQQCEGYSLVRPTLDKWGVTRGIDHLLKK